MIRRIPRHDVPATVLKVSLFFLSPALPPSSHGSAVLGKDREQSTSPLARASRNPTPEPLSDSSIERSAKEPSPRPSTTATTACQFHAIPFCSTCFNPCPPTPVIRPLRGRGAESGLMINRMAEGSLQPPEFNARPARLVVTLRRHGTEVPELRSWLNGLTDRDLSPEEDAVLVTINRDGESSIPRMHELLGYDSADLQKITSALRREGILRESAKGAFSIANGSPLPSGASLSVLDTLEPGDELSIRELSDHTGRSVGVLRRVLRELIEGGWVEATAPPTSRQRKYRRPR